jgi:hypothetical protein
MKKNTKWKLTILNALIIHARGGDSIPFSLSDGDVLREEDSIKSLGERSTLIFRFNAVSKPLVSIINSLSVDDSMSKSSFTGDDEWLFFLSWAFDSISYAKWKLNERKLILYGKANMSGENEEKKINLFSRFKQCSLFLSVSLSLSPSLLFCLNFVLLTASCSVISNYRGKAIKEMWKEKVNKKRKEREKKVWNTTSRVCNVLTKFDLKNFIFTKKIRQKKINRKSFFFEITTPLNFSNDIF